MSRILVPVQVLEGATLDAGVVDLLADDDVVLLGYHRIPEQTAPEQALESFGDRANDRLDDVEDALTAAGASVDRRLAFTHDPTQTRTRIAAETDCDAILYPGPAIEVERLLVVVHPAAEAEGIANFVADQVGGSDREVLLLSLTEDESVENESLRRARRVLVESGVDDDRITVEKRVTNAHVDAIVDAAPDTDVVVLGQRESRAMDLLLGEFVDRVQTETVGPVVMVRTAPEDVPGGA